VFEALVGFCWFFSFCDGRILAASPTVSTFLHFFSVSNFSLFSIVTNHSKRHLYYNQLPPHAANMGKSFNATAKMGEMKGLIKLMRRADRERFSLDVRAWKRHVRQDIQAQISEQGM
jgi:hypothetical protein